MKSFVANIDENNFDLLNKASKNSGIEYRKGIQMTASGNDEEKYVFHPIFCKSIDEAVTLIKEYTNIKSKNVKSSKDLILHDVLIKMLGF